MEENNKAKINIEMLKNKPNNSWWVMIPLFAMLFIIGMIFVGLVITIVDTLLKKFCIVLIYSILILICVVSFWKDLRKKLEKGNTPIEQGDFKIVEDKIYDISSEYAGEDRDGFSIYDNYIFTKIYGKIESTAFFNEYAKKDESIFLVFYNGNEQSHNYDDETTEYNRNCSNIVREYLACHFEISDEIKSYFVPYDEKLGDTNFNTRINDQIKKLEKEPGKVICKTCGTKYNASKQNDCTNCGSVYKFDMIDVIHEKEWYK